MKKRIKFGLLGGSLLTMGTINFVSTACYKSEIQWTYLNSNEESLTYIQNHSVNSKEPFSFAAAHERQLTMAEYTFIKNNFNAQIFLNGFISGLIDTQPISDIKSKVWMNDKSTKCLFNASITYESQVVALSFDFEIKNNIWYWNSISTAGNYNMSLNFNQDDLAGKTLDVFKNTKTMVPYLNVLFILHDSITANTIVSHISVYDWTNVTFNF